MTEELQVRDFPGARPVTLRTATLEDVDAIAELGGRFLRETSYNRWLWDNPTARRGYAQYLVESPDGEIWLLLEPDGGLIGMFGAFVFRHPMSTQTIAAEMFWWVDPVRRGQGLRLLKAFEEWSCEQNVDLVQMSDPADNDLAPLYTRLGYQLAERNYWRAMS